MNAKVLHLNMYIYLHINKTLQQLWIDNKVVLTTRCGAQVGESSNITATSFADGIITMQEGFSYDDTSTFDRNLAL